MKTEERNNMHFRCLTKHFFVLLVFTLVLAACNRDHSLSNLYIDLPKSGWNQDSVVEVVVMIDDTSVAYRGLTGIRHNPSYPYRNLYLFREVESERGIEYRDTIIFMLSDVKGVRQGSGLGHTREITAPFGRAPFKFGERGYYTFRIIQGMRPERVHGIEAIHFQLFPVESN
jgi:gliding motility-associated lipoprotein GldH